MDKDLEKLLKIGLGILGGFILVDILKNLNKCKNCGNEIPNNLTYCPFCGANK